MKYVYLVNAVGTDIYKIGFSKNPKNRIKSLQTGSSKKLEIIHSFESDIASQVEGVLHRRYSTLKKDTYEGHKLIGEWFELDRDKVKNFLESCKKIEENLKSVLGDESQNKILEQRLPKKRRSF
jgi:hypothetical protein